MFLVRITDHGTVIPYVRYAIIILVVITCVTLQKYQFHIKSITNEYALKSILFSGTAENKTNPFLLERRNYEHHLKSKRAHAWLF